MKVIKDTVYILNDNDIGVHVLDVKQGRVTYYRITGSAVIHTLPEQEFLALYTLHAQKTALTQFDKDLKELLEND